MVQGEGSGRVYRSLRGNNSHDNIRVPASLTEGAGRLNVDYKSWKDLRSCHLEMRADGCLHSWLPQFSESCAQGKVITARFVALSPKSSVPSNSGGMKRFSGSELWNWSKELFLVGAAFSRDIPHTPGQPPATNPCVPKSHFLHKHVSVIILYHLWLSTFNGLSELYLEIYSTALKQNSNKSSEERVWLEVPEPTPAFEGVPDKHSTTFYVVRVPDSIMPP